MALASARAGGQRPSQAALLEARLILGDAKGRSAVGSTFIGVARDGTPIHVAVCEAKSTSDAGGAERYALRYWDAARRVWDNPCAATSTQPTPWAVAMSGVWDEKGNHHESTTDFTFACEGGVIAKCSQWGYQPWQPRADGRSLQDYHQACTRMARADYCGDGRSHTVQDTRVDLYDDLGVQKRAAADPAMRFEAAWATDGAWCLDRARGGAVVEEILRQCPERFARGEPRRLGDGDECSIVRRDTAGPPALLRNRSRASQ